jgi:hypothetical protein
MLGLRACRATAKLLAVGALFTALVVFPGISRSASSYPNITFSPGGDIDPVYAGGSGTLTGAIGRESAARQGPVTMTIALNPGISFVKCNGCTLVRGRPTWRFGFLPVWPRQRRWTVAVHLSKTIREPHKGGVWKDCSKVYVRVSGFQQRVFHLGRTCLDISYGLAKSNP